MAKITAITIQKNNAERANLFVDGEFKTGVLIDQIVKFKLKVGDEIDQATIDEILFEDNKNKAFTISLNYLSKTLKTKRQVKDYLIKKGFSEDVVYKVIDKLKEYKYIDDNEYAKRYLDCATKTTGKRLATYKLMQKGVKKEVIESAYIDRDESVEIENAKVLAEKYLKNKEITRENVQKAYRYLIGRGFAYDTVDIALSKFKED